MKRRWQALVALPPAYLLCGMSMLTLAVPTIESPLYALAALMGTVGLKWALLGVGSGQRWIVVTLLGVGVLAVAWRLAPLVVDSLSAAASPHDARPRSLFWLLVSIWLVIGPLSI